jgi:hypothetical protein
VRHNLYTCCRCGQEQRTNVECDDAPLGWAVVTYQLDTVETIETERQLARTTLTTHACGDCCNEVLVFLEKSTLPDIDRAFDDGGAA